MKKLGGILKFISPIFGVGSLSSFLFKEDIHWLFLQYDNNNYVVCTVFFCDNRRQTFVKKIYPTLLSQTSHKFTLSSYGNITLSCNIINRIILFDNTSISECNITYEIIIFYLVTMVTDNISSFLVQLCLFTEMTAYIW